MCTILIVEDDDTYRLAVKEVLEDGGFRVLAARDGKEARGMLAETFDAALVDFQLPDANGLELLDLLKGCRPACPVLVLTSLRGRDVERSVLARGACRYLDKSLSTGAEILRQLRGALRQAARGAGSPA